MRLKLEELRPRAIIAPNAAGAGERLHGRRVLVTGAGGSIGSALSARVHACRPARLVLLDHSEANLHELESAFGVPAHGHAPRLVLGDLADRRLIDRLFADEEPQIVFHAAAYKQVPLLERQPLATLTNNVLNTRLLLDRAESAGVDRFVMTSTDKAVEPRSLMGASKRLAELTLLARDPARVQATSVRLVNVWGSGGSVLPRFERQLAAGEPLTVTDPQATRYFMTAAEAVEVTLAALTLSAGADILLPEPGPPLAIVDIARRLAGEAELRFTGLRPGDKLTERLHDASEIVEPTGCAGIRRVTGPLPASEDVSRWQKRIEGALLQCDSADALAVLREALPDYLPSETLSGWVAAGALSEEGVKE